VEGGVEVGRGNAKYVDLLAGGVGGYRWSDHWIRAFNGLGEGWSTFRFAQVQTSHAALLQQRRLLGSGIRRPIRDGTTTLDMGTGAMFESEDLAVHETSANTRRNPVPGGWRTFSLLLTRAQSPYG
jgi:hypothetical protein